MVQLIADYTVSKGKIQDAIKLLNEQNDWVRSTFGREAQRFRPLAGPRPMGHILSLNSFDSLPAYSEFWQKLEDTESPHRFMKGFSECFDGMVRGLYVSI